VLVFKGLLEVRVTRAVKVGKVSSVPELRGLKAIQDPTELLESKEPKDYRV
jgi:serine kinase of HPr protein (carbohydrate metabolism regulator)